MKVQGQGEPLEGREVLNRSLLMGGRGVLVSSLG